jgi:hypothetical protein
VRGTATYGGGLRAHRPACAGPVAAILIGANMDSANPRGPLDPSTSNDNLGLVPMRDDILARDGCLGSPSRAWNIDFPNCVTFTDCPAALPVVWCVLPYPGRQRGRAGNVSYAPGAMLQFLNSLPAR